MNKLNKPKKPQELQRQSASSEAADKVFLDRARSALDRGCESLDGYTRSRLTTIRHAAVEQALGGQGRQRRWISWASLTSACCLLLVLLISQSLLRPAAEPEVLEDLELFTSEVSLEFYEELEFYQWLAENGA